MHFNGSNQEGPSERQEVLVEGIIPFQFRMKCGDQPRFCIRTQDRRGWGKWSHGKCHSKSFAYEDDPDRRRDSHLKITNSTIPVTIMALQSN